MAPSTNCTCGAKLEIRHEVSRKVVSEEWNWVTWRVRFRCPRCRRYTEREFQVRAFEAEAGPIDAYGERS